MSTSTSFRLFTTKFPLSLLHHHHHNTTSLFKTLFLSTPQKLTFAKSISFQPHPTTTPIFSSSTSPPPPSSLSLEPISELPPKLQEIIKLFQSVQQPKAKYQQLLFYGKNLKPLETQFKTNENKVQGCVSQVWVRAYLETDKESDNKNVIFEADSDSVLTKGLAALLVYGLSNRPVEEIIRVSPDFVVLLGLQQSLTPSRNNGFLNMLKLMQRKALELYVESEKIGELGGEVNTVENSKSGLETDNDGGVVEIKVSFELGSDNLGLSSGGGGGLGRRGERIKEKLERELRPIELEVEDISYQHAGHVGVRGSGDGETHFNVKVVSEDFEGKSLVKRHRLIYGLLEDELQSGLHALSIVAKSPSED